MQDNAPKLIQSQEMDTLFKGSFNFPPPRATSQAVHFPESHCLSKGRSYAAGRAGSPIIGARLVSLETLPVETGGLGFKPPKPCGSLYDNDFVSYNPTT